jgi:hypothetical protein
MPDRGLTTMSFPTPLIFRYHLPLIITKAPNPKCRLYWCLIEFTDWRYSQLCWYFRPALCTIAHLTFSLVSPTPSPPSLCEKIYCIHVYSV